LPELSERDFEKRFSLYAASALVAAAPALAAETARLDGCLGEVDPRFALHAASALLVAASAPLAVEAGRQLGGCLDEVVPRSSADSQREARACPPVGP